MQNLLLLFCLAVNIAIAQPAITSFTPVSGQPGTPLTISGTGFDATASNNTVYFGAAKAVVTVASQTELTVTIPAYATYAPITVLNNTTGLLAYSALNFMPTFSPAGTIASHSFATPKNFFSDPNTVNGPGSVLISDLNGDGKNDLALVNANSLSILINSGTASTIDFNTAIDFSVSLSSAAIGDVNGDGKQDIVMVTNYGPAPSITILENATASGTWNYTRTDFSTNPFSHSPALGDLDLDGKIDIAIVSSSGLSVMRNTSTGGALSFSNPVDFTVGTQPNRCIITDFDYDGKPEIAVANTISNTVSVLRNTSTVGVIDVSSFAAKEDYSATYGTSSLSAGDIDGDGKTDLVALNYNGGSISVLINSGSVGDIDFEDKIDFASGDQASYIALGDLNGDGKTDVAVSNRDPRTISILRNTSSPGQVAFASRVTFDTNNTPSVFVGDLNGDNKPELAVGAYEDRRVLVYENIVKGLQTINFAALPQKTFGDNSFSLSATGGDTGNPIVFTSSDPNVVSINGNVVTIVGGGTVTITASQAGNDIYDPATDVPQTLVVNKANQTITFEPINAKIYGDLPFTLGATASSNLPVTYSSSNTSVATISGNTVTIVGGGSATITAHQTGSGNYNTAADVAQTLTVNKADQVITFPNISTKTSGDPPFNLVASSSSTLPVSFTTTSGNIAITANQATIINAGEVTITAAQPGNGNYNAAPDVSQTFCINPARPVITPSNLTAIPTLSSSASSGNQWYVSDTPITGATQNTLSVTSNGNYKVQVTAGNCISAFSEAVTIVIADTGEYPTDNPINVFPNPARDILTVTLGREPGLKAVFVFDITGKCLYTDEVDAKQTDVNISDYSQGLYLLKVQTQSGSKFVRFLKQ